MSVELEDYAATEKIGSLPRPFWRLLGSPDR
jgi:hypothetical protein